MAKSDISKGVMKRNGPFLTFKKWMNKDYQFSLDPNVVRAKMNVKDPLKRRWGTVESVEESNMVKDIFSNKSTVKSLLKYMSKKLSTNQGRGGVSIATAANLALWAQFDEDELVEDEQEVAIKKLVKLYKEDQDARGEELREEDEEGVTPSPNLQTNVQTNVSRNDDDMNSDNAINSEIWDKKDLKEPGDVPPGKEINPNEDPNHQGLIRAVPKAHLVYKRQTPDGTYEELWMYNLGGSMQDELTIRRNILAGTDIPQNKTKSPDGSQHYDVWTVGNGQLVQIRGLPQ